MIYEWILETLQYIRSELLELIHREVQSLHQLLKLYLVDVLAQYRVLAGIANNVYTAEGVLGFDYIWHEDLNKTVPGLTELVKKDLDLIQEKGMLEAVKTIL